MTEKTLPKGYKIPHTLDRTFMLGMSAVTIAFGGIFVTSLL